MAVPRIIEVIKSKDAKKQFVFLVNEQPFAFIDYPKRFQKRAILPLAIRIGKFYVRAGGNILLKLHPINRLILNGRWYKIGKDKFHYVPMTIANSILRKKVSGNQSGIGSMKKKNH